MEKILSNQELNFPQGPIKGAKRETIYGLPYYSFEGIPYAKPPLGDLRFKAPQPAEPWTEVLDCTMYRSKPTQKNQMNFQIEGSEDCLYINIYAKNLQTRKPLPVMVWIYGGGFCMGEATRERYSPDYFMSEDVILVSFNYRVDSLGFLSLKDPALNIPGNAGLKDQVLALKWIKKYISHFNGDPENITLFGESAGGASTHYMSLTEQARDLYQRAILQSCCAFNPWGYMLKTDMAYRLAKYHGYNGENIDKNILAFLQTLPAEKLVDYQLLTDEERRNGHIFAFVPTVEPYVSDDCVIPKPPLEMLKNAWSNSIPIIIGGNTEEGLLMYTELKFFPQKMNAFKNNLEALLPPEVRETHTEDESKSLGLKLKELHFGTKEPNDQCIMEFLDYYSYHMFRHGLQRTIMARLKYAKNAPTYHYRFNFDSPDFNLFRNLICGKDPIRGTCHADDLSYLFFCKEASKLDKDSLEYKTIEHMISLWTSFAKNSNPNCKAIEPTSWKPLEPNNPYEALNISEDVKLIEMPEKNKFEVWNTLYKTNDLY